MDKKLKVGILRETKTPHDKRVAVPPGEAVELIKLFPCVELINQPSKIRCYNDQEYIDSGLTLKEDLSECDILIGVKEVDIQALIPGKTYLFFSHTTKKQVHNRKLLQEIVKKNITLIDYEYLTDKNNIRLVAFGWWAGLVGAYNGLIAYGKRYRLFDLKPVHQCYDMDEMIEELKKVKLPPIKILITGGGRVAHGAMDTMIHAKLRGVKPEEFLAKTFDEPVFCQIDPWFYLKRKDGLVFDESNFDHFVLHPDEYESTFLAYTKVTDLFIPCHFWDPKSPVFMTKEDMKAKDFKMKVIADISCDIKKPVPSTIRASTIAEPFYGYDPITEKESEPFDEKNITVMAVDNLPAELPRNASLDFGEKLIEKVFPSLFGDDSDGIIDRATIVKEGKLTENFSYLEDYLAGKEISSDR